MKRYSLKLINVVQLYHLGLNMWREKRNKWKEIRKLFAHVTYSDLLRILQLLRREGFYEGFEGAAAIAEAREQQQQQPPKQLLRISLGRIGAHHVRSTCAYVFSSMWHSYVHTRSPRTDTPRAGTRAFSKYYRTIFLPPPPRAELCAWQPANADVSIRIYRCLFSHRTSSHERPIFSAIITRWYRTFSFYGGIHRVITVSIS